MRRATSFLLALTLIGAVLAGSGSAAPRRATTATPDIKPSEGDLNGGKPLPLDLNGSRRPVAAAKKGHARAKVGDLKSWLALDDVEGSLYLKRFKLRAMGKHIEVWVAHDHDIVSHNLGFQYGDCRNDERIKVTNKQVRHLIHQFESKIYPAESKIFRRPRKRDGSSAVLPLLIDQRKGYYRGSGKHIVALIDNVRDDNFYDFSLEGGMTGYIGGFFSSQITDLLDRNVMTIDSYDWLHRTGKNPPNDPNPNNLCKSKPARPYTYESTFAHEYQHLLEHYSDPDETSWVDEGLAMWIEAYLGYDFSKAPITSTRFFPHLQAFLGWYAVQTAANPNPLLAGPENSLNLWGDQGDDEILADYGGAYSFMSYLQSQYGVDFMSRLHHNNRPGFKGLRTLLKKADPGTSAEDVVHRWNATVALDAALDDGADLHGGDADRYSVDELNASINWDTEDAYASPGAPPNGADYVRLRDGADHYVGADALDDITFDGAATLPTLPVEWVVDDDPPEHAGNAALFSGSDDNLDRAIVRQVTVPADAATLTFDTRYEIEEGYDGGFVQVSTDGGATYDTIANEHSNTDWSTPTPGPGFTGSSNGWTTETFDLSAYAGQDVQLAFHYITDGGVSEAGWWIDNVKVGGTTISTGDDLDAWKSPSEVHPTEIHGFTLQLLAISDDNSNAWVYEVPLDDDFDATLSGDELQDALGDSAETVAALVTYDEPTEGINQYAPYTLEVNGVKQPGGGQ